MSASLMQGVSATNASEGDDKSNQDIVNENAMIAADEVKQAELRPANPELESWFLNDDVPGMGNKPEWLSPKFKTVAEQARAYKEAERKLGGFIGAPEEYDLSTLESQEDFKIDKSNPAFVEFKEFAKTSGMSQETFDKIMGSYLKSQSLSVSTPEAEIEKLGPDANQKLKNIATWIDNNFSDTDAQALKSLATSAENVLLLDKIRNLTKESGLATAEQTAKYQQELNEKYLEQLVQDPRYSSDPVYRADVSKKYSQHYG